MMDTEFRGHGWETYLAGLKKDCSKIPREELLAYRQNFETIWGQLTYGEREIYAYSTDSKALKCIMSERAQKKEYEDSEI